jgi:deoxyadenosine/deoxycytidine kinase
MRARKEKPFTINVEGIVGSGKSTFIDVFKAYPCVDVLPEPVSAWSNLNGTDLLQLMYENPRRWGMTHESYVQYTMLEEHLRKVGVIKTMERSIHSSRYIFTEDLKQSGLMEPAEFAILDEWYQMLKQEFDLSADVTVYLQASPEGALDRIRKRGRPEEAQITVDYLRRLQRLHEDWFVHRNSSAPLPSQRLILMDTNRPLETMEHVYRSFAKKLWHLVPKELIYTCQATTNRIFG